MATTNGRLLLFLTEIIVGTILYIRMLLGYIRMDFEFYEICIRSQYNEESRNTTSQIKRSLAGISIVHECMNVGGKIKIDDLFKGILVVVPLEIGALLGERE